MINHRSRLCMKPLLHHLQVASANWVRKVFKPLNHRFRSLLRPSLLLRPESCRIARSKSESCRSTIHLIQFLNALFKYMKKTLVQITPIDESRHRFAIVTTSVCLHTCHFDFERLTIIKATRLCCGHPYSIRLPFIRRSICHCCQVCVPILKDAVTLTLTSSSLCFLRSLELFVNRIPSRAVLSSWFVIDKMIRRTPSSHCSAWCQKTQHEMKCRRTVCEFCGQTFENRINSVLFSFCFIRDSFQTFTFTFRNFAFEGLLSNWKVVQFDCHIQSFVAICAGSGHSPARLISDDKRATCRHSHRKQRAEVAHFWFTFLFFFSSFCRLAHMLNCVHF